MERQRKLRLEFLPNITGLWWKTILIALGGAFLILGFSGFMGKRYKSMGPDHIITVGNQRLTIKKLAQRYRPFITNRDIEDGVVCMWYDAILKDSDINITYFPSWKNERHPNLILHWLYVCWRFIYYGSVQDIENISFDIELSTGNVKKIYFESPIPKSMGIIKHKKETISLDNIRDPSDNTSTDSKSFFFNVVSWNHLFEFQKGTAKNDEIQWKLIYLDSQSFVRLKFGRRSLPDWLR